MSANTTTQRTDASSVAHPSRLQLVYTAHQQLEDELDTFQAYLAAARKHYTRADLINTNKSNSNTINKDIGTEDSEGFSPWSGVEASVNQCVDKASRCLRLFNPTRKITHFKGMSTLTTLYGATGSSTTKKLTSSASASTAAAAAAAARVVALLASLSEKFEGELPPELALSGGRCLQRLDPAVADAYLVSYVQALLQAPNDAVAELEEIPEVTTESATGEEGSEDVDVSEQQKQQQQKQQQAQKKREEEVRKAQQRQRLRACVQRDHDSAVYRLHVRALLLLQIEAAATAQETAHRLADAFTVQALESALSAATCEELLTYEAVCWREAARIRAAQSASASSTTNTTNAPPNAGEGATMSLATAGASANANASTPAPSQRAPGAAVGSSTTRTAAGAAPALVSRNNGGAGGVLGRYKWQVVQVVVLMLLAVIVRFASGPIARALKGVLQTSNTVQSRRRTLTL